MTCGGRGASKGRLPPGWARLSACAGSRRTSRPRCMVEVERDRQIVLRALAKRGDGSALRGWRQELDPDGSLDTRFLDFCKAAARLKIAVDALKLFGEESPDALTLQKLAPVQGALVNKFRKWMADKFGGPGEMFMVFEPPDSDGKLTREVFMEKCKEHGFESSESDLAEVFNLLDASCMGSIAMEDVSFLDMDEKRRAGAIEKARVRRKFAHEHQMTEVYRENRRFNLSIAHRLAPRGWHAHAFEELQEVLIERRCKWKRIHDVRCREAGEIFARHLRSAYGNGVRAWRRGLDPRCNFVLRKVDLGRYCRTVNLEVDLAGLWKSLDRSNNGELFMEDVASKSSAALASFRYFVRKSHPACGLVWDQVLVESRSPSSWKSNSSLPYGPFLRALKTLGWPGIAQGVGVDLCQALDLYGCGIVCKTDLHWLDKWEAPDWLCTEADPEAFEDFSRVMKQAFGAPLRQWRQLDEDNSNEVSWAEFTECCDQIGWNGNRGGVWRHLDKGLNGYISLKEFDALSSEVMLSFKDFVDRNFGSVEYAFKSMDTDGSGSLTLSELKRACKRLKWKGDVRTLLRCLDLETGDGRTTLSWRELDFLDTWPMTEEGNEAADEPGDKMPPLGGAVGQAASLKRLSTDGGLMSPPISPQVSSQRSSGKLQRSASEPFRVSSGSNLSLPALKRRDEYRPGDHDPSWRKSKTSVKADILAAFRKQNDHLRGKTDQLRAEHKELEKQDAEEDAEGMGETMLPEEVGARPPGSPSPSVAV
uniref:EF-hand domain-containing protein n=1 Tax=Alexandrium monilatum TaxID=311494 RepID=A0A7S4UW69_9DINO